MRVTAKDWTVYTSKTGSNRIQKQQPSGEVKCGLDSSREKWTLYAELRRAREEGCLGNRQQSALIAATAQRLSATGPPAWGTDCHAQ